jgi:polyisoprenoid-binding protein YceI
MRLRIFKNRIAAVVLAGMLGCAVAHGEVHKVDMVHSVLKIRVFKSGFFSGFAHNHEIEAPISQGSVELSGSPSVTLLVDARKLRVLDPELSADKRAEVQKAMDGPQVLNSSGFPEISFRSTAVEKIGAEHWTVRGNLTLHGQTRPVVVDVALRNGHYLGSATLKQRDFGITPISIAGGTVKVKDQVKAEFDIVLAK